MDTRETLKGIVFGAVGGAAGTFLMSYYWKAAEALHGHDPRSLTRERPPHAMDDISVVGDQTEGEEASTEAVGRLLHEKAVGRKPSEERKMRLSEGVHWSYGIIVSAVYGAIRGRRAVPDVAGGAAFGTALWAAGDELMVPLLGLSKGPTAYPVEQHAHRLGVHLFYGIIAAATTQSLFRAFSPAPTKRAVVWDAVKTYATLKTLKSAARAAGKLGMTRRSHPIKGAIRGTTRFARSAVNGAPRTAMHAVTRSGRRTTRAMAHLFT